MGKHNSIFGQILQLISRYDFQKSVKKHGCEKHSKGFSSWSHFTAMQFAQLSRQDGLRGVERAMASHKNLQYHLGQKEVKRSTLSYANRHRSHELFKDVFESLLQKVLTKTPKHKFRFKNDLYSIDASTIDLCLGLHDWAKFRKTKGGIKLHVKLNHSGYIPEFVNMTTADCHEVNELPNIPLKSGDVVTFDRGYTDYERYAFYCGKKIYFVTRLKTNARYRVVECRDVSKYENISSDQIIEFTGPNSKTKCPYRLRRVRVKDPETGKYIVILTNQMSWSPATVGAVYKDRWQIEIFFKTMKQELKIKTFLGTSKNAIMIQIWTAMISYLLLSYLKFLSRYNWTINSLMTVIPVLLFTRKCLWEWLNHPAGPPPPPPDNFCQMELI